MIAADPRPSLSTSQPSPGQFAAAYEALLHRGCDEILSIHVTAATSGTLNAARLAARSLAGAGAPGRLRHGQLRCQLLRVGGGERGRARCEPRRGGAGRRVAAAAHRHGVRRSSQLDFIQTGGHGPPDDLGARHRPSQRPVPSRHDDPLILTMVGGQITVVSRSPPWPTQWIRWRRWRSAGGHA